MRIAIASGKGGTGKSTVAANLAWALSRSRDVTLVDCDVEEPNLHLFFPAPATDVPVTTPNPEIDAARCTLCGECGKFCRFGALAVVKDCVLTFPHLCHSCGGCTLVCPHGAIREVPRTIGRVSCSRPLSRLVLISGVLNEGEVQAPAVIRAAKVLAEGHPLTLYDASPGTSCPVIETIAGSDACILVTESTPFGLHDLSLAAEVAEKLGTPAGVVINRSNGQDEATVAFCREHGLPVLMTIPFSREIAAVQNRGGLISRDLPGWEERFAGLFRAIPGVSP
ncbi:MAG TPA: ATP-binding protein [Candidatus Methanoculleus thermohydrogenotrophicum]|jgi:MinD superfamily P-loop ATPase|nr:ATP-binding protein [Candidatus Methanoculleus thermohydrogenotrophicum]NLM82987.1 P-loop NTPase [Candidatus Methanoculleus thermohydrogenotrophicum]HOB17443.1 ATP-binding protein [Candidatus Methanoculleus thermohydrogenotrophicum]HPZ37569.1 ATP-binding protein [Candidatus Methanoculleus thermohydrogenotrophicum]HQC90691.1 ATP-binding protein [Candidatus Methanoculleus thermohydrogenotrophicum]